MVMEGLQEDMGDGNLQCTNHPYKNTTPGGICAFCLQEKLGKLVSSSFPISSFPSSSSSPSPSFRSDFSTTACTLPVRPNASTNTTVNLNHDYHHHQYYSRRTRIPFILTQKKNKKKDLLPHGGDGGGAAAEPQPSVVFKRSKSTTTPRRGLNLMNGDEYSPRKRGFWSFLYLSKPSGARKIDNPCNGNCYSTMGVSRETQKREESTVVDETESPNPAAVGGGRRVSRSRSVGCGSRSFSGDFFERISTGFGDCTLRRVESQREGKPKATPLHRVRGGAAGGAVVGSGVGGQDCIKERVKCGGIFGGFMITSSSSSSSSSSYWVSSSSAEDNSMNAAPPVVVGNQLAHGRIKSWGWALASPIRAFSKPSSGKRENKNTTPNLNSIPSLLTVGG